LEGLAPSAICKVAVKGHHSIDELGFVEDEQADAATLRPCQNSPKDGESCLPIWQAEFVEAYTSMRLQS
jgi:hypothetical protein